MGELSDKFDYYVSYAPPPSYDGKIELSGWSPNFSDRGDFHTDPHLPRRQTLKVLRDPLVGQWYEVRRTQNRSSNLARTQKRKMQRKRKEYQL